jgi:hypothetical protein
MARKLGLIDAVDDVRAGLQAIALEMLDLADVRERAFGVKAEIEELRRSADIVYHLDDPTEGMDEAERKRLNATKVIIEDPTPTPDEPFILTRIKHASKQVTALTDIIMNKR